MNAQLESAVQNFETPMAEFDQKGMIADEWSEQDEKKVYDALRSQCAARDSCGCKRDALEPVKNIIEERLNAIDSFGDPIPGIRKSRVGCEAETIVDLLSRRIDAHTLQLAAQGDVGSKASTDSVWGELKDFCADALPDTLQDFLRPHIPADALPVVSETTAAAEVVSAVGGEPAAAPTASNFNACGVNSYRSESGECAPLTVCSSNQYQSAPPTATSDRQCAPLTVCGSDQFQSVAPTSTTDRQCKMIQKAAPEPAAPVPTPAAIPLRH